jgi:hypothetical protein
VGTALRNHGYLDFLFPLLAKNPPGQRDHPLPLAFTATAMIAFAARQKVPDLLPRAEATYLRALEATFKAIGDPARARDNSTLACVTLLTTFEVLCRPFPVQSCCCCRLRAIRGSDARGKDLYADDMRFV